MNRKTISLVLTVLFLFAAGYSWAKVIFDYDPDADFAGYSTYIWIAREGSADTQLPDHLRRRLQRVTEDVLATKGLEPAPAPPQANLLLTYYVGVREELQVNYVPYSLYRPYGYGYWGGYGYGYTDVRRYNKGTVVLDVVDAKTHQLVWTGKIEKAVSSPNPSGDRIEKSVKKLLKNFPPR
ncbi:MAG: DUF4136 domain-containing protein [Thermoanaerobaculales bacterium]